MYGQDKKILLYLNYKIIIALISLSCFTGCDKEVSVTSPDSSPPAGKLFVSTNPQGAFIYLDGKNTGNVTPDTIEWLEGRQYLLTLKMNLFKDYSSMIIIREDTINSFSLDYHKVSGIYGRLLIDSEPRGAEVFINGISTGKITQTVLDTVFPGVYNVKFRLRGYWDDSVSVEVRSGMTSYPYKILTDSLTWVNFKMSNSGLPDDYINHIAIENGKLKWIATSSSGVVMFDDRTWTVYNSSNSPLPENNVRYIAIDNTGRKWICTVSGLAVFDNSTWEIFDPSNSVIPVQDITCAAAEGDNTVWIGTSGGGVVSFDGINWTVYNTENSNISSNDITTIAVDWENNKWIGTLNDGISKFDGERWTNYTSFKTGVSRFVNHITIDNNNVPWVSIHSVSQEPGGSGFFNGTGWDTYIGLPSSNVRYVAVDNRNIKWFGNTDEGLSKFDGNNWLHFTTSNSKLPGNRIFAVAFDGAGNKWLATYGNGIVKYKGN